MLEHRSWVEENYRTLHLFYSSPKCLHNHFSLYWCLTYCQAALTVSSLGKVKIPLDIFSPFVSNSRGWYSSRFQAVEPALVRRQFPLPCGQRDYDPLRWYLFIYFHLHAFELLGWRGTARFQIESPQKWLSIPFFWGHLGTVQLGQGHIGCV